jgi:CBS domain-containing protein
LLENLRGAIPGGFSMKAKDILTANVATATPETTVEEIARMLVEHDCGAIPIVKSSTSRKPVGIVTDRDIVCRVIAVGKNLRELTAGDCMSSPCVTVTPSTQLDVCCTTMEKSKIRRLVVVDQDGLCCGIVSQADVARRIADKAGAIVKEVSQPTESASAVLPKEEPVGARR